jgi:benzylsuccinate CoA-transferase BbsF subunit
VQWQVVLIGVKWLFDTIPNVLSSECKLGGHIMESNIYPLDGYRVLDFGTAWAGPQVGMILADMGAEVIKVETKTRPDGARLGRPIIGEHIAGGDKGKWLDIQPIFHGINRNKLSFTIDLKSPKARDIIYQLVKISDVVLDNSSPGAMGRLGLDHKSLEKVRPNIISISMTGCGETGSLKDALVYAPLIISLGGLQGMIGYYGEDTPMGVMFAYGDANASIHAAFATVAALWHRERTGEGQHIELSESWVVTYLLGEAVMDYSMNGRVTKPMGNRHLHMCPHNAYRCQGNDKWVTIAVKTEEEWGNFCRAIGEPNWTREAKFADLNSRIANQEELDKLITAWTINYSPDEVTHILQQAGVAAMPVMDIADQYSHPFYQERQTYLEVEHPLVGVELLYANPMRLSQTPGDIRRPAPSIGEHNHYVLKELLGMSDEQIANLMQEKVIY